MRNKHRKEATDDRNFEQIIFRHRLPKGTNIRHLKHLLKGTKHASTQRLSLNNTPLSTIVMQCYFNRNKMHEDFFFNFGKSSSTIIRSMAHKYRLGTYKILHSLTCVQFNNKIKVNKQIHTMHS